MMGARCKQHLSGASCKHVGHITLLEDCGSLGVIECDASSGGEWAGTWRYGFHATDIREAHVEVGGSGELRSWQI